MEKEFKLKKDEYIVIVQTSRNGSISIGEEDDSKLIDKLQAMIDEKKDKFVYNSDLEHELYCVNMNPNWSDKKKEKALKALLNMIPTKDTEPLNKD